MKSKNILFLATLFAIISMIGIACKKEEKAATIDPPAGPITSTTELTSLKVTTAPTMDGNIDAAWDNCNKLTGLASVPNVTDFAFYTGESYNFTMRSMYDAANMYFLVEYKDPKESVDRESWYFNASTKLWKQQNKYATSATDKFYEDKFAFMWPTSTATTEFNNNTCFSTCHGVTQSLGYTTGTKHYAATGEVLDLWHWKRVRTGVNNQIDDQKCISITDVNNPSTTEKGEGGRGSDAKTAGGYSDNKQTLTITGTSTSVSVPKYVIPGKTGYSSISQTEIDNGTAKLITAVDANGILTYAGGTIDPTGDTGYENGTGAKRFPSVTNAGSFVGSRGDITCYAKHTGTGWVIEIKRALTTSDAVNDVQFDPTKTYMFGFAIFENAAIGHGTKTNLLLKF